MMFTPEQIDLDIRAFAYDELCDYFCTDLLDGLFLSLVSQRASR